MFGQQQGGQAPGGGQGEGDMRLRSSTEFVSVLKQDAAYLLRMYDKAYAAYLTEKNNVANAKLNYDTANARIAELNAEKQAIYAERSQYKNASEKWEALHIGLDMEYQNLMTEKTHLNTQLKQASESLLAAQKDLTAISDQLLQVQQKNKELEGEVTRLKSGTSELIKAAFREKKKPTLMEQIRSVPGRIVNLGTYPAGTPQTVAAASGAWILAALFILGRIE